MSATPETSFKYIKQGPSVTIIKFKRKEADVVIPSEIKGFPVRAIGSEAFKGSTNSTSVIFPEGVKTFDNPAFCGCRKNLAKEKMRDS